MRWMYFRLGMLSSCFAFFIPLVAVLISPIDETISSYTGIIVNYGFSVSMLLMQFVIWLVQLEGEMNSVERLIEFGQLPDENSKIPEKTADDQWPRPNSEMEIKNLTFRYRPELEPVLKGISFKINPKEHIGIVGRTGAGKSSITVALYRLAESDKGSEINIDGVNTMDIDLYKARKPFSIIPQDPFLFSGTLR